MQPFAGEWECGRNEGMKQIEDYIRKSESDEERWWVACVTLALIDCLIF